MADSVEIDGQKGDGGALTVRSAMSLSLLTGRPFRAHHLRSAAEQPGLRRRDIALLTAAASIAPGSKLREATVGSRSVTFEPTPVRPGLFNLDATPSGAVGSILQTVALPLALAGGRSRLTITGGTHAPQAPSFQFLDYVWTHWMRAIGFEIDIDLVEPGFYPRGRGKITVSVHPVSDLAPLVLMNAAKPSRFRILSLLTDDMPPGRERRRADRVVAELRRHPNLIGPMAEIDRTEGRVRFSGASGGEVFCLVETLRGPSGFQQYGTRDEDGTSKCAESVLAHLSSGAILDVRTADQLLIPLSCVPQQSSFTVTHVTEFISTQMSVIKSFLGTRFEVEEGTPVTVHVMPKLDSLPKRHK